MYTTSVKQLARNKKMGVSKGFPDFLVITPKSGPVFIELKRKKGGRVSKEQTEWLEALKSAGCPCAVCYGAKEAIEFLESFV